MVIKWINRFSGEVGYVKSISVKEGHFNNTFDVSEARKFANLGTLKAAVNSLIKMGEAENNEFIAIKL